jgi:hypothetical protein
MAFTSEIEAAARVESGSATSEINDSAVLAMPRRHWSKAEARRLEVKERRAASVTVAAVELTHPCQLDPAHGVTTCGHAEHQRDAENVRLMLRVLGLVAPPPPPLPEPKPQPPARAKQCSRCKKTKPLDQFDRNRARGDGLATECKTCRTELYEQRRDRGRVIPDALRCAKCQLTKPAAQFSRDKSRSTGLTARCKDCRNTAKRERLAPRRRNAA